MFFRFLPIFLLFTSLEASNDTNKGPNEAHDCGPNEIWSTCAYPDATCRNPHQVKLSVAESFGRNLYEKCHGSRCVCKEGFVRHNVSCVNMDVCKNGPNNTICGENEYWDETGRCDSNCHFVQAENSYTGADGKKDYKLVEVFQLNRYTYADTHKETGGRCTCHEGFVRHEGKCVNQAICSGLNITFPQCGVGMHYPNSGEKFTLFSSTEGTCENPDPTPEEFCQAPKCQCEDPLYVRDKRGNCVLRWNCKKDEYYIPTCKDVTCPSNGTCNVFTSYACFGTSCYNKINCFVDSDRYFPKCSMVACPKGYECTIKAVKVTDGPNSQTIENNSMAVCVKK